MAYKRLGVLCAACCGGSGSTGYGHAALVSLPGRIGRQDVDDCMASLKAAVDAGGAAVHACVHMCACMQMGLEYSRT